MSAPRRLLVMRFGAVGDLVVATAALDALARALPGTAIEWGVRAALAGLVRPDPRLAAVVPVAAGEGALAYAGRLRSRGYDAVLDLHDSLRSRVVRWRLDAPRTVVWTRRRWQDTVPVKMGLRPWRAERQLAARYHAAVEALVGRPLPRGRLSLHLADEARAAARALLRAAGVGPDEPYVAIAPGAAWPVKRWPTERFVRLVERAGDAGLRCVLSGSPSERALCEEAAAGHPGAVVLDTDLPTWAAVIDGARAFVGTDSGPMHLARALGVPTVAIFGPTDEGQFDWTGHAAVRLDPAEVPCAPCHFYGRRRCPRGHWRCMDALEVEPVWRALEGLLAAPGPRRVVG